MVFGHYRKEVRIVFFGKGRIASTEPEEINEEEIDKIINGEEFEQEPDERAITMEEIDKITNS